MDGAVGVGKRYGNGVCGIGVKILGIEDAVELKNGSSRDLQRASKKLRFLFDCLCIALPVRTLIEDGFGAIAEGEGIVGRIEMNVLRIQLERPDNAHDRKARPVDHDRVIRGLTGKRLHGDNVSLPPRR